MKIKIYSILFLIFSASISFSQSVVVNKYFNSGASGGIGDIVELLIIQNNLDMRGKIIKDFSSSMGGDGGGKLEFKNVTLWQSIPAGTLIILRNDTSAADINPSDFVLDVGLKNISYFLNRGGTFDIATTEMVMIKTSSTDTTGAGVIGSIHVLAGGTAGTQFTSAPEPKLRSTGTSPSGKFIFAKNSTSSLSDFNGTDADSTSSPLVFGQGNNSTNSAFINLLRGTQGQTTIRFTLAFQYVNENIGTATINVSISNPSSSNATTVEVALTGGTATNGVDYSNFTTQTLTFPAGSSANQSFSVNIIDDSEIESDETIIFTLQNPSGGTNATLGTITTFTLTIQDNDTPIPLLPVLVAREDLNGDLIPDRLGQTVKVRGVVIGPNYQTLNFSYYIQDGNAGINVFRSGTTLPILNLADSIEVKGMIEHYRGLTEITFSNTSDLILLGTGTIPQAQVLSISSYKSNPEMYEGVLLKFTNVIKVGGTWPTAGQSATIQIAQGTDTLDLRIDSDTDIDDNSEPTWPRNITGIGSQFTSSVLVVNDGYQLLPRYYSDFEPPTSVDDENINIPYSVRLFNIFPNPFNPITKIRYQISEPGQVRLKVFNVLGKEILELENDYKKPGTYELEFNANKYSLTSGVYLLQLISRNSIATKKFILMK